MPYRDLLLSELQLETSKTRPFLERVPADKADFKPHEKSMTLGRLSAHVAQLGGFAVPVLTAPALDFLTSGMKPLAFESPAQLVAAFDAGLEATKAALAKTDDSAWTDPWQLRRGDTVFFNGTRYLAYRAFFANHIPHHRAQLGVYFRLLGVPVPGTYGPSADEA